MATPELTRIDSIDSLAEVDFLVAELAQLGGGDSQTELASEFKKRELRGEMQPEPLLLEDKQRFVLFPIKHTDVRFVAFG